MKTDQFNQILENLNEIPSESCWKTIENQLNILMPTNGNFSNGSNITTTKSSSLLSKIVAAPFKAAAITGGVIAVSTATIIFINSLLDNPSKNDISSQLTNQTTILQVDTLEKENIEQVSNINVEKNNSQIIVPISDVQSSENKPIETQINLTTSNIQVSNQTPQVISKTSIANIPNNSTAPNQSNIIPKGTDPLIEQQNLPETKPIKITIPNIFTPNGDGYNDLFVIEGIEECIEPKLYIKSTNGKLIYQSTNYSNDWNGENCSDGVYMYYFTYRLNNIEEKMLGRVIIKR